MCTGVYTAEMALAMAVQIVRKSQVFRVKVDMQCSATWESRLCKELFAEIVDCTAPDRGCRCCC